ncbi:radical SAM protein [bacterium]|nr:radical SAM protein [bacterium]
MQGIPVGFPDVIRIETVGKCNFKCIHCPTGTNPNNRLILSPNKFDNIVSQFVDNDFIPRVVVLYHGGEPLLNKNLSQYIQIFKELGVKKTVITTNASLLTEERSKEIILAGLDEIKISFDGQSPDENNHIRRNGDFYRNAKNVKVFYRLRKSLGHTNPSIIISNVQICNKEELKTIKDNQQVSFQHVPKFLTKYFSEECDGIEFKSFPAMVWPGYERFGNLDALYFDMPKPKYCGSMFETCTILSNGNVVLCCYDLRGELVLGNVFKESIFDIWSSKTYSEIRANFKKQEYCDVCRKCNYVSPRYLCKK